MQPIILTIIAGVIFGVLIELFCTTEFSRKAAFAALSLVMIYLSINALKSVSSESLIENEMDLNNKIELSLAKIAEGRMEYTKANTINLLENEGYKGIEIIDLKYEIEEFDIKYQSIIVSIDTGLLNIDKFKETIVKILPGLEKENVIIV